MKTKVKLLLVLLTVLFFSSCVIHEPEIRPDYNNAGYDMYWNAEYQLVKLTDIFDIALKLDSFLKLPDASKAGFKTKYLFNYEILISDNSNYILLEKATADTLYYFKNNNSKSLRSVNSEWLGKGVSVFNKYITIQCVAINNWKILLNDSDSNWNQRAVTNLVCTEKYSPVSYENSKFSLYGNGELTSVGVDKQKVRILYSIADSLKHEPEILKFKSGSFILSAEDLETNQNETATAEYVDANSFGWKMKITYRGRTRIYENHLYGI